MSSETAAAANKAKGDASKGLDFQFGSIGTQAHHDTYRSAPNVPTPSIPKQQLPKKDPGVADQSNTGEVHKVTKVKKDAPVPLAPTESHLDITAQYPQQQGGKYVGPRRTIVKIIHPDTHKEVRLDERADTYSDGGVSAAWSHSNVPQSQAIPTHRLHPFIFKQRQLTAILNKLTPQNFEKLLEQVKAVNIDNVVTLAGFVSQIFDTVLMATIFCEMYANFCFYLARELPDFGEDNEKITFKRLLLNKCQEEFERGEREQEEADKADKEGEINQTAEEREEKRIKARRRMLGNIRLIGELYKKRMLTERIMHECIKKLLGKYENPVEEDVEALCKLMSTIGEMIDHPRAKEHMDAYFDRMAKLSNNMKLSSRVRFMLKDAIELRTNKWQQRRKVEGPKKIEEVHRDAAQERQAQTSMLARGSSMNSSTRRGPLDFDL